LSQMTDYLINAAVLKDHNGAQVTLTMKNHYGSVNNPGSLHSSGYTCNPDIPALNQQIRDVIVPNAIQKIFVIDALFGTYTGGPSGPPNFSPKKLLMSFDTVACDFQGQNVINDERVLHYPLEPLSAPHIPTAASPPYSLGTTDVNLIEINNPSGASEMITTAPTNGSIRVMPNPFRGSTTIRLLMASAAPVQIDLIDPAGRIKDRIFSGDLSQGEHRIDYTIRKRLAAGNYFVRIRGTAGSSLKKVTILD